MADLNAKFTAALDRAVLAATQAGDLDAALALRDEKKRLADSIPLPADDKDAPPTLQPLRQTYRTALANLELSKNQRLAPLRQKYEQALAALFAELTKAGDLDGALAVKAERESLVAFATASLPTAPATPAQSPNNAGVSTTKATPSAKYDPGAAQAIIDWVFLGKGSVVVTTDGGHTKYPIAHDQADKFPKTKYELTEVRHGGPGTQRINPPFPWEKLPHVPSVVHFEIQQQDPVTPEQLSYLSSIIQQLITLRLGPCVIPPENWSALPPAPKLRFLSIGAIGRPLNKVDETLLDVLAERYPALEEIYATFRFHMTARSLPTLSRWKNLRRLYLTGTLDREMLQGLGRLKELTQLGIEGSDSTIEAEALSELKNISFLHLDACPNVASAILPAISSMTALKVINIRGGGLPADALLSLAACKQLERIIIPGMSSFNDTALTSLLTIKKLLELDLRDTSLTPDGLRQLHSVKSLELVKVSGPQITPAALTALRAALPKCRVYEK